MWALQIELKWRTNKIYPPLFLENNNTSPRCGALTNLTRGFLHLPYKVIQYFNRYFLVFRFHFDCSGAKKNYIPSRFIAFIASNLKSGRHFTSQGQTKAHSAVYIFLDSGSYPPLTKSKYLTTHGKFSEMRGNVLFQASKTFLYTVKGFFLCKWLIFLCKTRKFQNWFGLTWELWNSHRTVVLFSSKKQSVVAAVAVAAAAQALEVGVAWTRELQLIFWLNQKRDWTSCHWSTKRGRSPPRLNLRQASIGIVIPWHHPQEGVAQGNALAVAVVPIQLSRSKSVKIAVSSILFSWKSTSWKVSWIFSLLPFHSVIRWCQW